MIFAFLLLMAGMSVWLKYGSPRVGFLTDFAKLLDQPEFVGGFRNQLVGRTFLRGEFRRRKVVILLQHGHEHRAHMLVLSMETGAATPVDSYEFAEYKGDRESELALFALEAKHDLVLRVRDGCLKALWQPWRLTFFPGAFDSTKWQSVLEAMHTLAGSLERREAST